MPKLKTKYPYKVNVRLTAKQYFKLSAGNNRKQSATIRKALDIYFNGIKDGESEETHEAGHPDVRFS